MRTKPDRFYALNTYFSQSAWSLKVGDEIRHRQKFRGFYPIRSIRVDGRKYFITLLGGRSFDLDFFDKVERRKREVES